MKKRYNHKRAMHTLKTYIVIWLLLVIAILAIITVTTPRNMPIVLQVPMQHKHEPVNIKLDLTDGTIREVTAYNSFESQTDSSPCVSADSSNICERYAKGEQICAANFVPLGTKLRIDKFGTCTVADRMNKKYGNRVDIYMGMDLERALKFGKQRLAIKVL